MHRDLEPHRELEVVARDDRGRGEAADDLLGDVRAREHGDRTSRTSVDSRSPVAGSSPFVRLRRGASPASSETTSPKTRLGTATTTSSASANGASAIGAATTPAEVRCLRVARVPTGRVDRVRLRRVARGDRHLVPVVAQQARERRTPRARADDDYVQDLVTRTSRSRWRPEHPRARSARAARSRPSSRSRE